MRRTKWFPFSVFFLFLIFGLPSMGHADSRDAIIQRQLDEISNKEEFPGVEQDAGKVFSDPGEPEKQSAKGELKDLVDPQSLLASKPKVTTSNIRTRVHTLDVGGQVFYYRFVMPKVIVEPVSGVSTEEVPLKTVGPMEGVYANYTFRPLAGNFLNNPLANAYFLQARLADSRGLQFSGEGNVKKHDDLSEFRGLIGKDYALGADMMVTPYVGYGYRYLFDKGNGLITNLGEWLEDRKSHYYYLPVGSNLAYNMSGDWEADFNAEYDILLTGMQKLYLSDWNKFSSGQAYPDMSYRQSKGGFGLRGSVKLIKKGQLLDFYIEPYFCFWNIETSKEFPWYNGSVVGEPANNTTEIGSKFGVQF